MEHPNLQKVDVTRRGWGEIKPRPKINKDTNLNYTMSPKAFQAWFKVSADTDTYQRCHIHLGHGLDKSDTWVGIIWFNNNTVSIQLWITCQSHNTTQKYNTKRLIHFQNNYFHQQPFIIFIFYFEDIPLLNISTLC